MKRDAWVFQIPAADLKTAAIAKAKHHEERLEFWKQAQQKVLDEVKEKGLSVTESAAGSNYSSNRAMAPTISVDSVYEERISETHYKIKEHAEKVRVYDGWVQVLGHTTSVLELHADDYLFFFGK